MDVYKMFNWGLLTLTFGLLIYLGYLSSKYMNKSESYCQILCMAGQAAVLSD